MNEKREEGKFYLRDLMPTDNRHHEAIGAFIDDWGAIETALSGLFNALLKADGLASRLVYSKLGMRQAMDSILSLSTLRLSDDGVTATTNLMERVSRINTKRNLIVHGDWCLEAFIWPWKNVVKCRGRLLREIDPDDQRILKKIADPRNQKERGKHTLSVKQILAASRDAIKLRYDIGEFAKSLEIYALPKSGN